jgi:hypothetical protein
MEDDFMKHMAANKEKIPIEGKTFSAFHLEKWEELSLYREDKWIYRGQKCATRALETTFDRFCRKWKEEITRESIDRFKIENNLLREFTRHFHRYSSDLPRSKDKLEWLSIMQHYGAPTRLLDFTYSIYVGAYFALEEECFCSSANNKTPRDSAIWAVNTDWLSKVSNKVLEELGKESLLKNLDEKKPEAFEDVYWKEPLGNFVRPENPYRLNQRLGIQRGLFLCPGNIKETFMENLTQADYSDENNIFIIIIPQAHREKALKHLYYMGISQTNLFPGLDGFSKSLSVYHPNQFLTEGYAILDLE